MGQRDRERIQRIARGLELSIAERERRKRIGNLDIAEERQPRFCPSCGSRLRMQGDELRHVGPH